MTNLQIANTILEQLGGSRFVAMTGAKNFGGGENYLTFKVGRGALNGITHVTVTLEASDTYTVKFQRVHGLKVTDKGEVAMVYAEDLQACFTTHTGFDTRL